MFGKFFWGKGEKGFIFQIPEVKGNLAHVAGQGFRLTKYIENLVKCVS